MTPVDGSQRLAATMRSPAFYPGAVDAVDVVETHVSWVFLAGDRAYKLRKPVVFPFLDYGTADRRRALCHEEVRIGRRLAPSVYIGVRSVVERDGRLQLADAGARDAIEHLTEMRRFDERRTLAAMLARDEPLHEEVAALARHIAAFHADAPVAPAGTFQAAAVAATVSDNFTALLAHPETVGQRRLAGAHRFAVAFLHARRGLLDQRAADGHVRDGHGDLRAEHVILDTGIEIFDPLEFDPALRQIDVLADAAFLAMDLMAAGREDLADAFAAEYRSAAEGDQPAQLLWFYATYRAWVRAKVACLRAGELDPGADRDTALTDASQLAELGARLAWRARRPLTVVVCGASAAGKTVLASAVADASGLPHLNSDVIRKELARLRPDDRAPQAEYSAAASRKTYAELGARAAASPDGAIVDATFRDRDHRAAFLAAYDRQQPPPLFVECRAPAATIAERARTRVADPSRVSDATPELSARMLHQLDPLDEVPASDHIALRTDRPVEEAIDDLEAALDARLDR